MNKSTSTEIGLPIVLDDPHDGAPLSDEQRAKLAAWFDRSFGDRCREGPSIWVSGTIRCEELP